MAPASIPIVTTRILTRTEVDLVVEWAARVGWNPGILDAEPFFQADPEGFHGAFDEKGMLGCYSLVRYEGDMAFGGFYIVREDMRGKGFGDGLLKEALDRASPYNLGIDGVVEMVPKYERSGFQFSHENIRFRATGGGNMVNDLIDLGKAGIDRIIQYDATHFLCKRERFLRSFIAQPGTVGLASRGKDGINGFGVMRPCNVGRKIGPLFADDGEVAERILKGLLSIAQGGPVFLDVPAPNEAALEIVQRKGMVPVFHTARMYTKNIPRLPLKNIFGVTTFELG